MKLEHPTLITATIIAIACMGCEHATDEVVELATPYYTVEQRLAIDLRYDGHAYELASVYEDDFGNTFQLDTFRFLISGAYAVNDDEEVLADYSGPVHMVDASHAGNDFLLGELTSDHLHEIRFDLGLAPAVNHGEPSTAPAPLNDMSMHGATTADGYYFLQVTGRVDSNGDDTIDGTDQVFRFNCMGDDLLCPGAVPVHENLPAGGVLTATLPIDMKILLSDIDLLNTPSATGNGPVNAAWMQRLMDAIEQEH